MFAIQFSNDKIRHYGGKKSYLCFALKKIHETSKLHFLHAMPKSIMLLQGV
jgi:hypothetical protein